MHGRLGWLAGWLAGCFTLTKFACACLMASVDMAPGEQEKKKKRSHATAEMGGRTARDGRADKQKAPSVFISVTFGRSAIALLHAKQRASAAEGRAEKKKKALTARASGQALCPMSVFTDTLDRREWEQGCGSCGKGTDKKDGGRKKKTKTGVINHVSDALTHS